MSRRERRSTKHTTLRGEIPARTPVSPRSNADTYALATRLGLSSLLLFARVIELGSISAAARAAGRSQPSVSKQVALLERVAGLRLIERRSTGIQPTPAGLVLYKLCSQMLDALDQVTRALSNFGTAPQRVVLGVASGVLSLATGLIRDLRACSDLGVQLTVTVTSTKECLRDLQEGKLDLALVWDPGCVPQGLSLERLGSGEHAVVLPATHPLAAKSSLTAADLRGCDWILPPRGTPLRDYVERTLRRLGITPLPVVELTYAEAVKVAVQAGLGVTILARSVVAPEVAAGALVARSVAGLTLARDLCLVWRRVRPPAPGLARVADFIRAYAASQLRLGAPSRR
jgi:LysR family nitrogen assimilation transcriptional regulator